MDTEQTNPAWDPAARARVQQAIDQVLYAVRDIQFRYCDEDGFYQAPSEIAELGDVTGLIAVARHQVIQRLQDELDRARGVMRDVHAEVDAFKRERYGDNYKPMRDRDL